MSPTLTTPLLRKLGTRSIHPLGLGCMGMSEFYGASDDAESLSTLQNAFALGVTHFDTADTYGFGHNERLLGQFLRGLSPSDRQTVVIASKFGIVRQEGAYERRIDNSPDYIRKACEASLKRLGIEQIDLFYCHRRTTDTPLADMMGALSDLMREGKIAAIGLSEVSAETLREAHALHPIAAIQTEYSLWERGAEARILPTAEELGIAVVAYSPLGRAFLTDKPPVLDQLAEGDFRRALPRFNGEAAAKNQAVYADLAALAKSLALPVTSLALAWILNKHSHTLAIPGTRRSLHLAQNFTAAQISLPQESVQALDRLFAKNAIYGERYPEAGFVGVETR